MDGNPINDDSLINPMTSIDKNAKINRKHLMEKEDKIIFVS